jgi:peptide methionine sulfoxide reductase MsrA
MDSEKYSPFESFLYKQYDDETLRILGLDSNQNYRCEIVDSDDEDEDMIIYKKNSIERKKRLANLIQERRREREELKNKEEYEENYYSNEVRLKNLEEKFEKVNKII